MRTFIFCFLISLLSSCGCDSWGVTELGNNFVLFYGEGKEKTSLLYCTTPKSRCCSSGLPIIDSGVSQYNYDKHWIIAKSKSLTNDSVYYWVIDKNFDVKFVYDSGMREKILKYEYGPLDSIQFVNKIKENAIGVTFK